MNIQPVNLSPLLVENLANGLNRQVIIIGHTVKLVSKADLDFEKKLHKNDVITDINKVAKLIFTQDMSSIDRKEMETLLRNFDWIQGKSDKHNTHVKESLFLSVIDRISKFFGGQGLIYNLSPIRLKLYSEFLQKKEEEPAVIIEFYHKDKFNFIKNLQTDPNLCKSILNYLKMNSQSLQGQPSLLHLLNALNSLEKFPHFVKKEENFLKVLIFIEENKEAMKANRIESLSKRNKALLKTEYLGHKITYSSETGEVTKLKRFLGKGSYKTVYKIFDLISFQMKAISKQNVENLKNLRMSEKEVELMKLCKGLPHVVQMHSATSYHSKSKKVDIQQVETYYYNMGTLDERSFRFSREEKIKVMRDVIEGVMGLHKLNIVHRDLKPANIFLEKTIDHEGEEEIHGIVGDLGLSCLKTDPALNNRAGTLDFMPPEVLNGQPASFEGDAWAIGMILSKLFSNKPLLKIPSIVDSKLKNDLAAQRKVVRESFASQIAQLEFIPEPTNNQSIEFVIWSLTRPNPQERLSLEKALAILKEQEWQLHILNNMDKHKHR